MTSICGEVSYCMFCCREGFDKCDPVCSCLQEIDVTFKRTTYVSFKSPSVLQLPSPPTNWLTK
jgi:hypothetical protein